MLDFKAYFKLGFLPIILIVHKKKINYSFVFVRQGWIKTRNIRGVGLVGWANLLQMEYAIKRNTKPFTAWGPGLPTGTNFAFQMLCGAILGNLEV